MDDVLSVPAVIAAIVAVGLAPLILAAVFRRGVTFTFRRTSP